MNAKQNQSPAADSATEEKAAPTTGAANGEETALDDIRVGLLAEHDSDLFPGETLSLAEEYRRVDEEKEKAEGRSVIVTGRIGAILAEKKAAFGTGAANEERFMQAASDLVHSLTGRPYAPSTVRRAISVAVAVGRFGEGLATQYPSIDAAARTASLSDEEKKAVDDLLVETGTYPSSANVRDAVKVIRDTALSDEEKEEKKRKAAESLAKAVRDEVVKVVSKGQNAATMAALGSAMAAGCILCGNERKADAVQAVTLGLVKEKKAAEKAAAEKENAA